MDWTLREKNCLLKLAFRPFPQSPPSSPGSHIFSCPLLCERISTIVKCWTQWIESSKVIAWAERLPLMKWDFLSPPALHPPCASTPHIYGNVKWLLVNPSCHGCLAEAQWYIWASTGSAQLICSLERSDYFANLICIFQEHTYIQEEYV